MHDTIVYIDLGSSGIRAYAGYVNEHGELEITADIMRTTDNIKNGIVIDPHNTAFTITELIKMLSNKAKLNSIDALVISANARSMKSYTHRVESPIHNFVSDAQLREMEQRCKREVESDQIYVFEMEPTAYYIDGDEVEDPARMRGKSLTIEYKMIIGNIAIMDAIEKVFYRTTLPVKLVLLGNNALSTALLEEEEREMGTALISFGGGTTSLSIYYNGQLQNLMVVPLGGINITKDISELEISDKHAELLKIKKGVASEQFLDEVVNIELPNIHAPGERKVRISTRFLSRVIEARVEETLEPIIQQIKAFPYPLEGGIVITGGASKLRGLGEYIEERTVMPVRMGDYSDWLSDATAEKYLSPEYAQAVGAMILSNEELQAKRSAENQIVSPILSDNFLTRINNRLEKNRLPFRNNRWVLRKH